MTLLLQNPFPFLRPSGNDTDIALLIVPKSSRNKIMGVLGGALKMNVTAPPSDGAANQAVIDFVASILNLSRHAVVLRSGVASRRKTVRVSLSLAEVTARMMAHLPEVKG